LTWIQNCAIVCTDTVALGIDTKRVQAMKKRWLRGMLLGVSLALLLSGGVALAQSLTVEPECFQCFDGTYDEFADLQPGYPFSYSWRSCGWEPGEQLLYTERFVAPDEVWYAQPYSPGQSGCVSSGDLWGWSCDGEGLHHGAQAGADNAYVFPQDYWGLMEICVQSADEAVPVASALVCKDILFAEVCAAEEEEFVPEPGSLLLLGSGVAGLAGYAGLRWRSKQ